MSDTASTKTTDHIWLYGGTNPDTICLRCGMRRDEAPLEGGGSQRYAPCTGHYNAHLWKQPKDATL